jgi:opacity protein-like surface antigen
MRRLLSVAAMLAGLATPAAAQQFNWTGFYVGANGGYGWNDGSARVFESDTGTTVTVPFNLDSWFAGFQAGYNHLGPNNVLWGIEADIQWTDGNDRANVAYANGTGVFTASLDWFATLRGRAGVVNGPALYYVTGGLAWPGANFTVFIPFDVTQASLSGKPRLGWVAGAGVEWTLGNNWTAKFEYQYLDFGARTVNALGTGGETVTGRFDLDMHTIRFGLNLQFASGK